MNFLACVHICMLLYLLIGLGLLGACHINYALLTLSCTHSNARLHALQLTQKVKLPLYPLTCCVQVGEVGIVKFGEDLELLHPFDQPFTDTAGSQVCFVSVF